MKKFVAFVAITIFLVSTANAQTYKRVIVLAPNLGEIFAYLDLANYVVGRAKYCDYPAEIAKKPIVGNFSDPNEETMLALNPDAVFTVDVAQARLKKQLQTMALPLYIFSFHKISDISSAMKKILEIMGDSTPGRVAKIAQFNAALQKVKMKKRDKSGIFLIWDKPLMAAGTSLFINDIMAYAGIKNTAAFAGAYSEISPELLVKYNPDVIILGYMTHKNSEYKNFLKYYGKFHLKALKKANVIHNIDPDLLVRAGPRIIYGIKDLEMKIH